MYINKYENQKTRLFYVTTKYFIPGVKGFEPLNITTIEL
jgi:hypothetical protein